jgi:hypothetical protein
VQIRVAEVHGTLASNYRTASRRAEIPMFLYPLLTFIGKVSLPGVPAVYYPGLTSPAALILNATDTLVSITMSPEEIEAVSHKVVRLKALGAHTLTGVPRDPNGTVGFMMSATLGGR